MRHCLYLNHVYVLSAALLNTVSPVSMHLLGVTMSKFQGRPGRPGWYLTSYVAVLRDFVKDCRRNKTLDVRRAKTIQNCHLLQSLIDRKV